MMRPAVLQKLGKSLMTKRVFMVTGVRLHEGHRQDDKHHTAPVAYSSFDFEKSKSQSVTSQSSDFVWAFSLRQMFYRWGQITESSTYKDGATLEDRTSKVKTIGQASSSSSSRGEVIVVDGSKPFSGEGSGLISVQEVHAVGDDIQFVLVDNL
ncbi:hypothetical protein HYALB_00008665 [Hymenoscyphus albidus]|uniref:Uncharacterized protein n=1 Tax=Hymenoscyphus albidus TaxID=595503 RepID=A0A9N9LIT6_9HELO|nr:hypothetical protein HYALB_00008665 [Hymenoscyphus albidus]